MVPQSPVPFTCESTPGIRGNEIADGLARGGSALRFLGPKPAVGISRRDLQKRLGRWLVIQHGAEWRDLSDTQRQAREIISGPGLSTRVKFLTFNRVQSRVVTGLLTGHNTLRRHLYLLGLLDSPLYRKCGVCEKTLAHILCECEALATLRHAYLGSFLLEPGDIRSLGLGAIWNYSKVLGLPWIRNGSQKACSVQGLGASGLRGPEPRCKWINQSINQSLNSRFSCGV